MTDELENPDRETPPKAVNPDVLAAGKMIRGASKAGMVGSGLAGVIGLICLIAGGVMVAIFNSQSSSMGGLVLWPLMMVGIGLMIIGGLACLYAVMGFGMSGLIRLLGNAVSQGKTGSDTLALGIAASAAVTAMLGALFSLARGDVPIVGAIVAVVAGRIAWRLWQARQAGAPAVSPPAMPPTEDEVN